MLKYIIRRVIVSIFVLFVMSAMIYTIFAFAPGDPVGSQMDPNMTDAMLTKLRAQYGLDQPVYKRYFLLVMVSTSWRYGLFNSIQ